MENKDRSILLIGAIVSLFGVLVSLMYFNDKPQPIVITTTTCKQDSLQNVINQLQIEHENDENGWDNKEKRYEEILFEYEFGLEHLKNYHTEAYKEFHRIIGYKEKYSHETERENKKRININKW